MCPAPGRASQDRGWTDRHGLYRPILGGGGKVQLERVDLQIDGNCVIDVDANAVRGRGDLYLLGGDGQAKFIRFSHDVASNHIHRSALGEPKRGFILEIILELKFVHVDRNNLDAGKNHRGQKGNREESLRSSTARICSSHHLPRGRMCFPLRSRRAAAQPFSPSHRSKRALSKRNGTL